MTRAIYETRGRAREFNELAINLFTGCGHSCIYCYGADVAHIPKAEFDLQPRPRVTTADIERDARLYEQAGEKRSILLCFITDCYQPIEAKTKLTRSAIEILHKHNLRVTILTKAGKRAMRDFDLLIPGRDAFAVTLTCQKASDSAYWEPGAAPPLERQRSLLEAHKLGLETWVSLEPVIYPQDSIAHMMITREFVGHFKIGLMNYHPHGKSINWEDFAWRIKRIMDRLGVKYYIKQDLARYMGLRYGFWSA